MTALNDRCIYFNELNNNINFTIEMETDNNLAFLHKLQGHSEELTQADHKL